jgi:hypothetical protein
MTSLWFVPHSHSGQGKPTAWADETVGAAAAAANATVATAATVAASRRVDLVCILAPFGWLDA